MPLTVVGALKGIATAAKVINEARNILGEGDQLDEKLDQALADLQDLKRTIVTGIADILEAIDGIRRQINEDVALDNISLSDRALFNDLLFFGNHEDAMGNAFQAADRLRREDELVFAGAFMYVVNNRHAVVKACVDDYICDDQIRQEFHAHRDHLQRWIDTLNTRIGNLHTVDVEVVIERIDSPGGPLPESPRRAPGKTVGFLRHVVARHLRDGVVIQAFVGPHDDLSQDTTDRLTRRAQASRGNGVAQDRRELGVVAMEETAAAWAEPFTGGTRRALAQRVLNRRAVAIDRDPRGLMVDGQMLPVSADLRAVLENLLASHEFRRRIERTWDAFVKADDDRIVRFAYRRLFDRDAGDDDVRALREVATRYGYPAFIATLLRSDEYTRRFGRGLPGGGGEQPVNEALEASPDG